MKVTRVFVKPFRKGSLRAFADVEFDSAAIVTGFKVFENQSGLFAVPPSQQGKDGEWYPTLRFSNEDFKKELLVSIVTEYKSGGETQSTSKTNKPKPKQEESDDFHDYLENNWP